MSELKFSDLVEPVAVDQKTALRVTVLGGGSFGTAMANIAVVFHWPPQAYVDMSLTELMQWHQKAIERNGTDAE